MIINGNNEYIRPYNGPFFCIINPEKKPIKKKYNIKKIIEIIQTSLQVLGSNNNKYEEISKDIIIEGKK